MLYLEDREIDHMNTRSKWDLKDRAEMICKNCGSQKFKDRDELNEDEALLLKRLPKMPGFSAEPKGDDLFCQRCLYQLILDRHDRFEDHA